MHVFFVRTPKFRLRLDVLIFLKIFSLSVFLLTFLVEIQTKNKKKVFDRRGFYRDRGF